MAEEEQEDVPKVTPHALKQEEVEKGLSGLAKTIDSTSFAFTRLECARVGLNKIDLIKNYKHLRYLELPGNLITDLSPLEGLTYLLSINLAKNALTTLKIPKLDYLQVLNVVENKITALEPMELPMLRFLFASKNMIAAASGLETLQELEKLELDGNQMKTGEGIGLPQIKHLKLAGNQLTGVTGLGDLMGVATLDLSGNQIASLEGIPASEVLKTLILKGNKIAKPADIEPLQAVVGLTSLEIADNPITEVADFRIKIIRRLPKLLSLDEEPVTDEEREAAKEPEEVPVEENPEGEAPPEEE